MEKAALPTGGALPTSGGSFAKETAFVELHLRSRDKRLFARGGGWERGGGLAVWPQPGS